jgi:chemotaxis receptor (MCP) glutamine deamidase CheD/HD-like signal output (HDOD) protein
MARTGSQNWVSTAQIAVVTDPGSELFTVTASGLAVVLHSSRPAVLGLAHVVLPPSPSGQGVDPQRPALRADAGTRELVRRMVEAGARLGHLRATIVGGADVLSAAGRSQAQRGSLDAVTRCLEQMGVKIRHVETGGDGGRRVVARLDDGHVSTQPTPSIGKHLRRKSTGWNAPKPLLRKVLRGCESLRCDSAVGSQVLRMLRGGDIDWSGVWKLMRQDAVMVLHMLRRANAVSAGKAGKVSSLGSAIKHLGPEGAVEVCRQAAWSNPEGVRLDELGISGHRFNRHAMAAASLAVGHARKHKPQLAEMAEVASLLHGLRQIVVALASRTDAGGQYLGGDRPEQAQGIECSLWGQLTASVLLEWNLPPDLAGAVAGPGVKDVSQLAAALGKLAVGCCRKASQAGADDQGYYRCPWDQLASKS